MTNTPYYNLKKPSQDDFYNVQDFNDNAQIIDQKLHEAITGLTDGSVSKIGTANLGNEKKIIYLVNGVPTEGVDLSDLIIVAKDLSVESSSWVSDATFADFPYKAEIEIAGVTADHVPDVTFDPSAVLTGKICPVAQTATDKVIIFASEIPAWTLEVLSIVCRKEI